MPDTIEGSTTEDNTSDPSTDGVAHTEHRHGDLEPEEGWPQDG